MQQKRGRVSAANSCTPGRIDACGELGTDVELAALQVADMQNQRPVALRVAHFEYTVLADQLTGIAHLSASLPIEGCPVEHDANRKGMADFGQGVDELL